MKEDWAYIPGFDEYMVSNHGNVQNIKYRREITPRPNQYGHIRVGLVQDGRQITRSLAPLVAEAFLPRTDLQYNTVIHLDGDLSNCRADNLMWRSRPFAINYHKQFQLDDFHNNYQVPLVELESGETYESVKDACIRNGLYWYDVVKSYVEETFVPITFQEFRMVQK